MVSAKPVQYLSWPTPEGLGELGKGEINLVFVVVGVSKEGYKLLSGPLFSKSERNSA